MDTCVNLMKTDAMTSWLKVIAEVSSNSYYT